MAGWELPGIEVLVTGPQSWQLVRTAGFALGPVAARRRPQQQRHYQAAQSYLVLPCVWRAEVGYGRRQQAWWLSKQVTRGSWLAQWLWWLLLLLQKECRGG